MIVDAQVHLWDEDRPDRPWPPDTSAHGHRRITGDELVAELDAAGVDRAVLVPPSWEGERNDVVLAAARAHPDRFLVMGRVASDTDPAALATWTDDPQMAGIRITCHRGPQRVLLTSEAGDWLWGAAEAAGVPVMLYAPGLDADVERLVTRFPNLRLAVDHVNLALAVGPDTLLSAIEPVLALARFPNVSVKASGLECHSVGPERLALIGTVVVRLVAAFGAERVFWGTDLTRIPCAYRDAVSSFVEGIPGLGEPERSLVMGEAILRWLPWPA
jgi:L-fuconolactonase